MASIAPVADPVPATEPAAEPVQAEEKTKRTYKKRKNAAAPAPPPVEAATPADALQPLPEDATGFRLDGDRCRVDRACGSRGCMCGSITRVWYVANRRLGKFKVDTWCCRKRSKKEDYTPVPSSSVPGMSVGEVRKVNPKTKPYTFFAVM